MTTKSRVWLNEVSLCGNQEKHFPFREALYNIEIVENGWRKTTFHFVKMLLLDSVYLDPTIHWKCRRMKVMFWPVCCSSWQRPSWDKCRDWGYPRCIYVSVPTSGREHGGNPQQHNDLPPGTTPDLPNNIGNFSIFYFSRIEMFVRQILLNSFLLCVVGSVIGQKQIGPTASVILYYIDPLVADGKMLKYFCFQYFTCKLFSYW